MRRFGVWLVCMSLMGCTAVDRGTLRQLEAVDLLRADPGGFQVWLELPEGLAVQEGSAQLTLRAERGADVLSDVFVLASHLSADGTERFRIASEDLPRLRQLQSEIRIWKAEAPEATSGSLSLALEPCARGLGPAETDVMRADIALVEGGPRRPLIGAVTVRQFLDTLDVALQPCR